MQKLRPLDVIAYLCIINHCRPPLGRECTNSLIPLSLPCATPVCRQISITTDSNTNWTAPDISLYFYESGRHPPGWEDPSAESNGSFTMQLPSTSTDDIKAKEHCMWHDMTVWNVNIWDVWTTGKEHWMWHDMTVLNVSTRTWDVCTTGNGKCIQCARCMK